MTEHDEDDDPNARTSAPDEDDDPLSGLLDGIDDGEDAADHDPRTVPPGATDTDTDTDTDTSDDPLSDEFSTEGGPGIATEDGNAASKAEDGNAASKAEDGNAASRDREPTLDDDSPLGGLANEIRDRRRGSHVSEADDLFDSVDVDEMGDVDLWEQLSGDDDFDAHDSPNVGGDASRIDESGPASKTEYVVSKREFCQRCEFFSAPPEVSCGHDGTTIVELTDSTHFRVRDCPFVEEENLVDDVGEAGSD